jgi:hypothetical protein
MSYTKLEGVNRVLSAAGFPAASSLEGIAGSSLHSQAEYMLEFATKRVLARGHRCNTVEMKKYTLASAGSITFASDVAHVVPAGPTQRRNIVKRGSTAYDNENGTATFPAGDYFFNITVWLTFADVEAATQEIIMEEAAKLFQQQHVNNPQRDAAISEHQAKAEVTAPRITPPTPNTPRNNAPLVMQPAQQ